MRQQIAHVFAFVVIAVVSCGGNDSPEDHSLTGGNLDGGGVLLVTGESNYQGGSPVEFTIQNKESERLAYNPCTRELEVRQGVEWVPGPASLRLCTKQVWYVEAGASQADSTDLDLGLAPGEYRLVITFAADFAPEGEVIRAVSNSFTITP